MTKSKPWPSHADQQRMDVIALALDLQHTAYEIEHANERNDRLEIAKLTVQVYQKSKRIQTLMQEARRL